MRVGVIGRGLMGRQHARVYRELPGVGLAALAEADPSARAAAAMACELARRGDLGEIIHISSRRNSPVSGRFPRYDALGGCAG